MRVKRIVMLLLALVSLGVHIVAQGDETAERTVNALEKLRSNFIDLPVTDFGPGPIAGLYEFLSDGSVLYYNAGQNLLFVGDIYSSDGRSLTAARLAALQSASIESLPLELALKIGDGKKRIVEFTDPECPYCQAYHKYVRGREGELARYIFFYPLSDIHPRAIAAAVHILCAEDKQKAFIDVYERKINFTDLTECAEGKDMLARHVAIGNRAGVRSTPTLMLGDGKLVAGFDQAGIAEFLARQ